MQAATGRPNGFAPQGLEENELQEPGQGSVADGNSGVDDVQQSKPPSIPQQRQSRQSPLTPDGANTCADGYLCPADKTWTSSVPKTVEYPLCDSATQNCECWDVCIDGTFQHGIDLKHESAESQVSPSFLEFQYSSNVLFFIPKSNN